jgi:hypothetical protein
VATDKQMALEPVDKPLQGLSQRGGAHNDRTEV